MTNRMAQNESRQSARMPIVARVCQNFLKRQESREATFCQEDVAGATPISQVNFPVLLGSKFQSMGIHKMNDTCELPLSASSPNGTPTSAGTPIRCLSFGSNASSNAASAYSVKNTFIHLEDCSDLESLPDLKRSSSEPIISMSQSGTTKQLTESTCSVQSKPSRQQVSIGSVAHESGNCRPCAWFWKAQGCENGSQCRHCHLCSRSEIKRRRYKKLAEKKKLKQDSLSQEADANEVAVSIGDVAAL